MQDVYVGKTLGQNAVPAPVVTAGEVVAAIEVMQRRARAVLDIAHEVAGALAGKSNFSTPIEEKAPDTQTVFDRIAMELRGLDRLLSQLENEISRAATTIR